MRGTPRSRRSAPLRVLPLLVLPLAAACKDGPSAARTYEPVECGQGTGQSAAAGVDAAGGTITVGGHALILPAQAVTSRTTFTITERAAGHIGVEVEPHGTTFGRSATLVLSFARCGGLPAGFDDLRVVEVRQGTTEVIRVMPSVVNAETRTVTTTGLQHLSGYLIGGNRSEE
ncbi:MAG TPA: hypothetical protein VFT45_23140 [Longimicrobium sp.]|nr:hypothetical protein [Longimicrobium sp.]